MISLALSNRTSIAVPAPTSLTATLNSNGSITLSQNAPNDGSVTSYQVLRRRLQESEGTLTVYVSDTGSTATSYTDTAAVYRSGSNATHAMMGNQQTKPEGRLRITSLRKTSVTGPQHDPIRQ